jgi:hypothetical protein
VHLRKIVMSQVSVITSDTCRAALRLARLDRCLLALKPLPIAWSFLEGLQNHIERVQCEKL